MSTENNKVITLGERVATSWFGIIVVIFSILCIFQIISLSENVLVIIILAIRIISNAWVRTVAQMLKRNTLLWGTLAFFFPGITPIIISRLTMKNSEPLTQESNQKENHNSPNMDDRMMDWKE